jgi:hypothetical protein
MLSAAAGSAPATTAASAPVTIPPNRLIDKMLMCRVVLSWMTSMGRQALGELAGGGLTQGAKGSVGRIDEGLERRGQTERRASVGASRAARTAG